jgi:protocatechuate 3,4-dioxygenase beta subunit
VRGDVTVVWVGGSGVRVKNYRTDAAGRVLIPVEASTRVALIGKADGHASAERILERASNGVSVVLTLPRAATVSGRVVDESGRGVGNAWVAVRYPSEPRIFRFGQELGEHQADAFGFFTLPCVAVGKAFVLDAYSEDRAPSSTPAMTAGDEGLRGVTVQLRQRGQSVRVQVLTGQGQPVQGVLVRARAAGDGEQFTADEKTSVVFQNRAHRVGWTGEAGWVDFHGVPAGRVTILVQAPSGKRTVQEVLLRANEPLLVPVRLP